MRVLDLYWKHNKKWYYYDGLVPKIRENAPEDVKQSFEHYKEQIKENNN